MSKLAALLAPAPDCSMRMAPLILASLGTAAVLVAVYHERRMHRHRQPGVTYGQATFRRDGGWRRTDLFTMEGLAHQRRASTFGVAGAALWLLALALFVLLA